MRKVTVILFAMICFLGACSHSEKDGIKPTDMIKEISTELVTEEYLSTTKEVLLSGVKKSEKDSTTSEPEVRTEYSVPSTGTTDKSSSLMPEKVEYDTIYKIAIYTDMLMDEAEAAAILYAEEQYGDTIVRKNTTFDPVTGGLLEREITIREAVEFAENPDIAALLFITVGRVPEPSEVLAAIKEARPDIFCIALNCYPWSQVSTIEDTLMDFVDIELSIDQIATAKKAVEQAKKMGAEVCIDYVVPDNNYFEIGGEVYQKSRVLPEVRSTIETECLRAGMKYIEELGPNYSEPDGFIGIGNWPYDKISDNFIMYGNNVCQFSSQCLIQRKIEQEARYNKGIIVQLCHPGPFHHWWKGFFHDVELTDYQANFGDLAWAVNKKNEDLKMTRSSGRYATWRVPFTMAATTASVEYAVRYCKGEIKNKVNYEELVICFKKAMDFYGVGDVEFDLNLDATNNNHFMFTQEYVAY